MFHDIPEPVLKRMKELEAIDTRDRIDGTPQSKRLRQIPPDTGRFLALLAASAPEGVYLEIGASAGYSTLWLALACRELQRKIVTFEIDKEKVKLARETFSKAEVDDVVQLVAGDARDFIKDFDDIVFCFLDAEKEDYIELFELIVPRMKKGGLLIADNVISHADTLSKLVDRAQADDRLDAVVVPIGKGELVCRRM